MKNVEDGQIVEIGGDIELPIGHIFWKKDKSFQNFLNRGGQSLLTCSGRASLRLILERSLPQKANLEVLLPAYLFQALLSPWKEYGLQIRFYRLKADLSLDFEDIKRKINPSTAVLYVIHYFGFPQPLREVATLRSQFPGLIIIEDLAQAMGTAYLGNGVGGVGDYAFNVCIKYLPVPDGSLLMANNPDPIKGLTRESKEHLFSAASRYLALNLKYLYLKTHLAPKPLFRRLLAYSGELHNRHRFKAPISWVSRRLLARLDYEQIFRRRIDNYTYLLDRWDSSLLTPFHAHLPQDVCPLGFMVVAERRDQMIAQLSRRGIYCPVHWRPAHGGAGEVFSEEISQEEFPDSIEISRKIMMIPIDQRYGPRNMDHILESVRELSLRKRKVF